MEIIIKLSVEDTQYVLNVLGQRPYAEVNRIISSVKAQGDVQIEANKRPPDTP